MKFRLVAAATAAATVVRGNAAAVSAVAEKCKQDDGDNDYPKGGVVKEVAKAVHRIPPYLESEKGLPLSLSYYERDRFLLHLFEI